MITVLISFIGGLTIVTVYFSHLVRVSLSRCFLSGLCAYRNLKTKVETVHETYTRPRKYRKYNNSASYVGNSRGTGGQKVSQEYSHSFWLALSCPNLDVKAHKCFASTKLAFSATEQNKTPSIAITNIKTSDR